MTADRDDLDAILAKHRFTETASDRLCECGFDGRLADYAPHLASVVSESDWLRRMRAKELREAADDLRPKASVKNVLKARLAPMRMAAIWDCAEWLSDRADRVDTEDTDNTTDRT